MNRKSAPERAPEAPVFRVPEGQPSPELKLGSVQQGARIKVTWDAASPHVRHAFNAILSVSDGARRTETELDRAALASGVYWYSPSTKTVMFTLSLKQPGVADLWNSAATLMQSSAPMESEPARARPRPAAASAVPAGAGPPANAPRK